MNWEPADLTLARLILHEVPATRPGTGPAQPLLADEDRELDADTRTYFQERITETLQRASVAAVFDASSPSPAKVAIQKILADEAQLVPESQVVARHLAACQTAVNTGGLLTVMTGSIGGHRAVCVMKLQREEGVHVVQTTEGGHRTFDVNVLTNLMLTKQTRVFKVGLFVMSTLDGAPVEIAVSDNQLGYQASGEVARFFLNRFLGCDLADQPEILTKKFYDATQAFINDCPAPEETKTTYEMALVIELQKQVTSINPNTFASDNLREQDRAAFRRSLTTYGLNQGIVLKDLKLVNTALAKLRLQFSSGVVVTAPPAAFGTEVRVTDLKDGRAKVEIEGSISRHGPRAR